MGQIVITLDGIVNMDSGYGNTPAINVGSMAPSTDAIAEVKLLVSNYTAEYGARNGGQLNVTIKNGTPQFHGGAYYEDGSRASGPPELGLFEYAFKIANGKLLIKAGEMPTPGSSAGINRTRPPCG